MSARHAPAELRIAIEGELARANVPGCSVAVCTRDAVEWSDGFGIADIAGNVRATRDTVHHLFSGTKIVTATAVMQLVEAGRIALDDAIGVHVPSASHLRGVTVRHLLSHASGLKDSLRAFTAAAVAPDPAPDAEGALRRYPLVAGRAPGEKVAYRNVNYALLGALVARVSGMDFREYVHRRVLEPLGVGDAGFSIARARERGAGLVTGYIDRWDPMRIVLRLMHPDVSARLYARRSGRFVALTDYDPVTAAAGGLVGTVGSFAGLVRAHLAEDERLLSPESYRLMRTLVARGAAGIESREGTGLGWKLGVVAGHRFMNHEGGGPGCTSELRIYPEQGLGIALAMNVMRMPGTMRVAHRICEAIRLCRRGAA
jgi:CubicO group peptidase (beta-lactamase class C family)